MMTPTQLFELFSPLSHWQDRYRQIIQLSKILPALPETERLQKNQIDGCENKVWLSYIKNNQQQLFFSGDSEGRIVKGLLAILIILSNGKTAQQIKQTDFTDILQKLKLIDQLSESRRLGLANIIEKIRSAT